ncbi:putative GCN5-related N-acetyltransferase [Actinoplanes missouriensis 431]|uniref:Putative GCN5-related N-acetyltransferase n=1 Tax=Actinoplanes missouriensis (strain ATCC 14538 / DSM 43046 / CBS 188.64 / JCM 3121 / NBRC 102363 / NCIMB 12654 / NRRL B-3342 / UNCC 431) TaxID=512565 RepID=I0HAD1_ACTM4|nr:GNAT family N-acetyltransferase [Actinoplanes missouriensis]BAL89968.1 putative GCN5-related N-acetyltransferase [Actinoplanes missouriensis 431]
MSTAPQPTGRLAFAEMTAADLDDMAALLGDPEIMRFYPHPKSRAESLAWIELNRTRYRRDGFGLWTIRDRDTGAFVGDCGLTVQEIDGVPEVEVGYHVRTELQGRGYAAEAAGACRDHAVRTLGVRRLIAIIDPANIASQRVAEKIGLRHEKDSWYRDGTQEVRVYAAGFGSGQGGR